MPLTLEEGRKAVELARETVEAHVRGERTPKRQYSGILAEKRGVFVTLNRVARGEKMLRGCIGYSEPIKPLGEAIQDVAAYASEDPRFPRPVGTVELDEIAVEVSVLTLPRELKASNRKDLPSKVKLGKDGIIVSKGSATGLFLPQVATEQGWDQETYFAEACMKAGLPPDSWLDGETSILTFQAEVFAEATPRGEVGRVAQPEA